MHSYLLATHYDPNWYKAWHTWALANFEVIGHLESQKESTATDVPGSGLAAHIVQAVQGHYHRRWGYTLLIRYFIGFFHSIALRNENALQDTLRLLTLWFKFGAHDDVSQAMASGFSVVEVDTWLEVIPQVSVVPSILNAPLTVRFKIIARIQTPSGNVRRNINNLLTEVGKHHPQALIYPLTVASKSSSISRKNAALNIMDRMREHSPVIVEQVRVFASEGYKLFMAHGRLLWSAMSSFVWLYCGTRCGTKVLKKLRDCSSMTRIQKA